MRRLNKVATVIINILTVNSSIEAIIICEGPIKEMHIKAFLTPFKSAAIMAKFFDENKPIFHQPKFIKDNWGLMLFTDKKYHILPIHANVVQEKITSLKLHDRFLLCELSSNEHKYI